MKIGDLVKFRDEVEGMENLRGIIVRWNGDFPMVAWFNRPTITIPTTEVPEFIEIVLNKEDGSAV